MSAPIRIEPDLQPTAVIDPAVFIRGAFEGAPLAPLIAERFEGLGSGGDDAARLFELGVLLQLVGERDRAMLCQQAGVEASSLYRHPGSSPPSLRLLSLSIVGDLMANTPFELMVEGRGLEITKVFLSAERPWPQAVPEHDLAVMAIGESDDARALLEQVAATVDGRWPRPMINRATPVMDLARDRLYLRLAGAPGVVSPPTLRMPRDILLQAARDGSLGGMLEAADFPLLIVRPVGSHAGRSLERIDDLPALEAYLAAEPAELFYVSTFIDYAGADGLYRKARIAFFGGRPFLCHMAVSEHWMVHYLNAGMAESEAKRAEEQRAMETFDEDFAVRHAVALSALADRIGLDYFAIDCAELPDGSLLIFEADVAMIIHDFDPAALYPYKKVQMRKVFDGFEAFLLDMRGRDGRRPNESGSQ